MTDTGIASIRNQDWRTRLAASDPTLRVHLLGIGGAGLSAIATVLLEMGLQVSGSDRQANAHTQRLAAAGARVFAQQAAANLTESGLATPDVVLMSSAVGPDNPERRAAEALGLPVVKRDEFLPALLARRKLIAVAGSHGKSTTTAMIAKVLQDAHIDAGYIVGADVLDLGNAAAGSSPYFVLEADEYDHMFLALKPTVAVITNVEWDHPDCYPTPASFRQAFMQFADAVKADGLVVSCIDDEGAELVRAHGAAHAPRWMTYGLDPLADMQAIRVEPRPGRGHAADLLWWHAPAGKLELAVPGVHNVRNALAALAVACWCDVPTAQALASLAAFQGTARRFELKGECAGVTVIDDYAHHPTEIAATLAAARQRYPDRRLWAVFQPHTFSRTERMIYRMGESFGDADHVVVTDIFAAREVDEGRVSAAELVAASPHPDIRHIGKLADVAGYLAQHVEPGAVVITLGAGDSYTIGEMLLAALAARASPMGGGSQ